MTVGLPNANHVWDTVLGPGYKNELKTNTQKIFNQDKTKIKTLLSNAKKKKKKKKKNRERERERVGSSPNSCVVQKF